VPWSSYGFGLRRDEWQKLEIFNEIRGTSHESRIGRASGWSFDLTGELDRLLLKDFKVDIYNILREVSSEYPKKV
jgi:hypothetical protein